MKLLISEAIALPSLMMKFACFIETTANFIINEGNANASDIESLIENVKSIVKQKFNVELKPEVRIVGEHLKDGSSPMEDLS